MEQRDIISFCSVNNVPAPTETPWVGGNKGVEKETIRTKGKMDVEYMLETMEKSRTELNELGYDLLLAPNVLYDYRAIFMKIYGRDTKGNHVCPKTPKTPLGEDYGSTTFSRETVSSQVES